MKLRGLTAREQKRFLKAHPHWRINSAATTLTRVFPCQDYIAGLVFMARIAVHAEISHHHPDITLTYGKVKVSLTTHELKGLSQLDTALAAKIDALYEKS